MRHYPETVASVGLLKKCSRNIIRILKRNWLYNQLQSALRAEAEQCFGRERRSGSPRKKGNCVVSETRLFSTIALAARCGAMAIASVWLEDSCTEK